MAVNYDEICGKIRAMRHAGYADHEIGYAIGWDFGREHEQRRLVEMSRLHEEDKKAMLAAWTAHHKVAMAHARAAAQMKPMGMACLLIAGLFVGMMIGHAL